MTTATGRAFEITEEDIENVLREEWARFEARDGESFEIVAERVLAGLTEEELARIERAALDAGTDLEDQVDGAYRQIEAILEREGWLAPSTPAHQDAPSP